MSTQKSSFKQHTLVGPGGLKCPCCAPQSGNKYSARAVVIMKRQAKRREQSVVQRLVLDETAPEPKDYAAKQAALIKLMTS